MSSYCSNYRVATRACTTTGTGVSAASEGMGDDVRPEGAEDGTLLVAGAVEFHPEVAAGRDGQP